MHSIDKSSIVTALSRNKTHSLKTQCYSWTDCFYFPTSKRANYQVRTFLPCEHYIVQSAVLRLHVVRPSVRLSVCDVGGGGPHRLEIVALRSQPIYKGHPPTLPEKYGEIWGDYEVGWGKVACWSTKAAISLKRIKIEEKLLWMAYIGTQPTLFRTVPSPTPYGLPFFLQDWGFATHPKTPIAIISGTGEDTDSQNVLMVHPNKSPLKALQ